MLVYQFILGGNAKQTYVVAAQLLDKMAKMNQEVERDYMMVALMAQINELDKKMFKINSKCKKKDKYNPPHERKIHKENEVKCIKG